MNNFSINDLWTHAVRGKVYTRVVRCIIFRRTHSAEERTSWLSLVSLRRRTNAIYKLSNALAFNSISLSSWLRLIELCKFHWKNWSSAMCVSPASDFWAILSLWGTHVPVEGRSCKQLFRWLLNFSKRSLPRLIGPCHWTNHLSKVKKQMTSKFCSSKKFNSSHQMQKTASDEANE